MLGLRTSYLQGTTIRPIVPRQKHSKMAIDTALRGFDDLGHSAGDPYISFQKQIFFTMIYTLSQNEQKQRGKLKDFCPQDIEYCHLATARCVKLWSLNSNLFFKEPHQLTKFT